MRYFFCTGEASGELSAAALAGAIRDYDPQAQFEGIGAQRMRDAGFSVYRDNSTWATMGPLAAAPRVPKMLMEMRRIGSYIARTQPDLVVLVDFGAFNQRLAKLLRRTLDYQGPILYLFPPATWLDNAKRAREVATLTVPLTAFEHQYAFYKQLQLPIVYFGHPLAPRYAMRPPRPAPPGNSGTVAMLPGSRAGELGYHLPLLVEAVRELRVVRPQLHVIAGASSDRAERTIARALVRAKLLDIEIVRGVEAAISNADAAWVASGTAVLETALSGVPCVALYKLNPLLVRYARSIYKGFYTLPNLVLERSVVPELIQEDATPQKLASTIDDVLRSPQTQYDEFVNLHRALGPPDALNRCAKFSVALAKAGVA